MRAVVKLLTVVGLTLFVLRQEGALSEQPSGHCGKYPLVGWVERVRITPGNVVIASSLMAGAEGAAIHAENIERFKKDGKNWVRFDLVDYTGEKTTVEKELARVAKVRRQDGTTYPRYVVELGICIGDAYVETQVRLQNRANREHRMFIGRDVLAGNVIVNPAVSFSVEPSCRKLAKGAKK